MGDRWNIALLQPPYPDAENVAPADVLKFMLDRAEEVREGTDLAVLPEFSNAPGIDSFERMVSFLREEGEGFLARLQGIARNKRMHIAVNAACERDGNYYNTTIWIDRNGERIAAYEKTHPTEAEMRDLGIRPGDEALLVEVEGIRFAFATCFDLYFPEWFEKLASLAPDAIVVPTYQRSERSDVIEVQARARALDSGAYVLRCSYSMGQGSATGGRSMVVRPNGEVLCDAGQGTGVFYATADLKEKWVRPRSHGQPSMPARGIVEAKRRPELYRTSSAQAAAAIPVKEARGRNPVRWPGVIAHRGWSGAVPENTLAAFGAALALGVEEIELDIRLSKDGELIIIHDETVDRTTNGSGPVGEFTWAELQELDAGSWFAPEWAGLKMTRFDEVMEMYGGKIIFNVHVYEPGENGYTIKKIKEIAERFGAKDSIYIAGGAKVLEDALIHAPEIERCCLHEQTSRMLVDHAIKYRCGRLQFFVPYFTEEDIRRSKEAGIRCNVFWADTTEDAELRLRMGMDAILTNHPLRVIEAMRNMQKA